MTTDDVRRIVREELRRSGLTAEIVTDLAVNDDGGALGKGLGDRDLGGDFAGQYGIYSRPLDGADGIALNLDGAGNFSILIGYRNRQYEVQIEKGEVLLRDDQGQTFHLKRDGIYLSTPKNNIVIQDGTAAATREGDPVNATAAFKTWLDGLVAAINGLGGAAVNFGSVHIADAGSGSPNVKIG
jgi:phage gp45-like